ncbi:ABC transporter permease [Pilimelia columellifera]|uniref:ABC-2 type transporter transmembrane domain-containing protein n=1 Tax=Pilimelia columellifera subsp. columellifera TaxID=706583 RepID=A0ABN3NSY1_9ACTN
MYAYARVQALLILRSPGQFAILTMVPLYSSVFFTVLIHHHRQSAATVVALTAFGMSMWAHAMFVGAEAVDDDRRDGTLEHGLLRPENYLRALVTRVSVSCALSLPVLGEVIVVGRLLFGLPITVARPAMCLLVIGLVVAGTVGAALLTSALMVLVHAARTMQNAMTYPFYLLGGLLLPASTLPPPFDWLARGFFLAHGFALLRELVLGSAPHLAGRLILLVAMVLAQLAVGVAALRWVMHSSRHGKVSLHG